MSTVQPEIRILVVDDEPGLRQSYIDALSPAAADSTGMSELEAELFETPVAHSDLPRFAVAAYAQGLDAVSAVEEAVAEGRPFAVAFIDVRMPPGINGVETACRIRELDPQINIVIVTGYSDANVPEIAAKVKPADKLFYACKPLQVPEVRQQASVLSARWLADASLIQQLKNQNEHLRLAMEEAARARSQAIEANNAKSIFISNVSHELRTPLNAVIGFSDILAGEVYGPIGDPRYLDYAREIGSSGKMLLKSINELIDTSRLDVGRLQLETEEIDLPTLLNRVVEEISPATASRNITLDITAEPRLPLIAGDPNRVSQVIGAILQNASKFAPSGSRISVSTGHNGDYVRVAISDQGPGIPEDIREKMSKSFVYEPTGNARPQGGLGLGLWLARRLIELQSGALTINSEVGKGTTVWLDFPKAMRRESAA